MKEKVIIDTNLWLSYLISKDSVELKNLINNKRYEIIFSDKLINEIKSVLIRPKFSKYITSTQIDIFLEYLSKYTILQQPTKNYTICRDLKDNYLLDLAFFFKHKIFNNW